MVIETLSHIDVKCILTLRIIIISCFGHSDTMCSLWTIFLSVCSAISIALYQANQLTDFNKYNHCDNLLGLVSVNWIDTSTNTSLTVDLKSYVVSLPFHCNTTSMNQLKLEYIFFNNLMLLIVWYQEMIDGVAMLLIHI